MKQKKENNKTHFLFNVDKELWKKFKAHSAIRGYTMTELIIEMIHKAIELDIYVDFNKKDDNE